VITTIAVLGLIVTALVLIRMYQKIFYGPVNHKLTNLPDIKVGDWAFNVTLPLIIVLLVFGIFPKPLMDLSNYAATVMAQVFTNL